MRWGRIGSAGWGLLFLLGLSGVPEARAASYPDMLGRTVVVPDRPLRLVTLAPSLTEIVFALDRGEWVAGVSAACDYPAPVRSRPKVGGIAAPNLEQIARLAPDLIFASAEANTRETLARLDRLGLPVFAVKPAGFDGILESIRLMGAVLRAEHTERLTQSIRDRAA
ncbi:MAG: helical backbone metal receptor, partial [Candidatus Methylomirabilota bacterium]